jgi:hypothetical protein
MREIPLTRGYVAIVDDEDYDMVMAAGPWCYDGQGYATKRKPGTTLRMHRFIMGLIPGDGKYVDHRNGNKLDNRRCNLRLCTNSQNMANQGMRSDNTSGYKGVSFDPRYKKYIAQIRVNGRHIHLGTFADPADAALAHDDAARLYFGEFAVTNF